MDDREREYRIRRKRARLRRERQLRRRRRIMAVCLAAIALILVITCVVLEKRRHKKSDAEIAESGVENLTDGSGAEDTAGAEGEPTEDGTGENAKEEELDPAVIEQLKAERNLSPAVASFALGYEFHETPETYHFPSVKVVEEPEEEEDTEAEVEGENDQSETNSNLELDKNGDGVVTYEEEGISSKYLVLIDADTNEIIAERDADEIIVPASMTKALSVLVAVEQMKDPASQLEDKFTLTSEIEDFAYTSGSSAVCWMPGDVATVRDLLYGTVLPSGADAALALAQYTSGTHEAFVELMNQRLETLGISDTAHFTNCVGLYDENHYCTVKDIAAIMKACMENDLVREVMAGHVYTTSPTSVHPEGIEVSNWFLRRIEDKDSHGLVLCAKTGFVQESGFCAVSYMEGNDGGHYILVTADAWGNWRCIYDHVMTYTQFIP